MAVDRAVKAVEQFGLQGDLEHWKNLRQSIHQDIYVHGFNPSRKAFTQYYGSDNLDASPLMIPLVGFLPPSDERVTATIELIQKEPNATEPPITEVSRETGVQEFPTGKRVKIFGRNSRTPGLAVSEEFRRAMRNESPSKDRRAVVPFRNS